MEKLQVQDIAAAMIGQLGKHREHLAAPKSQPMLRLREMLENKRSRGGTSVFIKKEKVPGFCQVPGYETSSSWKLI